MKCQSALIVSTRRCTHIVTSTRFVSRQSQASHRTFCTSQPHHLDITRPSGFAFKWFRRSTDGIEEKKYQWQDILARYRRRGEISANQASKIVELLEATSGTTEWLQEDDIIATIGIVLRTDTAQHAETAVRLYELLDLRRRDISDGETAHAALIPLAPELVRAMAIASRDQQALTLCTNFAKGHDQPLLFWKVLLASYRDNLDMVGFLKVRDYMTMHHFAPDVHILNLQLELLNLNHLFADAQTLYHAMPIDYQVAPNWETRTIMLEACMNASKTAGGDDSMSDKMEFGRDLYRKITRQDLNAYAEAVFPKLLSWLVYDNGSIDAVHEKAREMSSAHGIEVAINHVNAMLYAANVSENWLMVERLWKSFESLEIFPTNHTFSLRIAASVMARDTIGAKNTFEASKLAGFADMLDPLSLQTLLAADMMSSNPDDALCSELIELLEKMQPFPITSTSLMFLIPKLLQRKKFAQLEGILERSRERPDWSTAGTINSILEQLPEAIDEKAVWNSHVLLKNLFWNDPAYNLEARKLILQRLIDLEQPKMVGLMFTQFLRSEVKPDNEMYIFVLQGARKMRDYELIRKLHQIIKMDMNISEHSAVLNTLMNAYAYVNSTLTFDIWEQIYRSGRGPSQASVSIIIDGCTYARMPVRGRHIWQSLERSNFKFNDNNYASYVEMLNKFGATEEGMDFLSKEMKLNRDVGRRAITTLHNTSSKKSEVAAWAAKTCPQLWESLQK